VITEKIAKASDRRVHRRIDKAELPVPARVSIPNRPAISLVDLSSGGALLELPFQMQPDTRVPLAISTPEQNLVLPFRLLRCYVAEIKGGVRYHAAGAFEQTLNLPALSDGTAPTPLEELIATLETFLRTHQEKHASPGNAGFHQLLAWVIEGLRRGDPPRLIAIKIKAHLGQQFPSLLISPASELPHRDARTSARFFGYDFRSHEALTRSDRRVLRAGAQMIALLETFAQNETTSIKPRHYDYLTAPSMIIRTIAEWQLHQRSA
jgi:hypothetical protein